MNKFLSLLALVMVLALFAGCNSLDAKTNPSAGAADEIIYVQSISVPWGGGSSIKTIWMEKIENSAKGSYTGDYYVIQVVRNGEIGELYVKSLSVIPAVLTDTGNIAAVFGNVIYDSDGFVTSLTPLYEIDPVKYQTGHFMLGTKTAANGELEVGYYIGGGEIQGGYNNASTDQNRFPTFLKYDDSTKVFWLGVGEEDYIYRLAGVDSISVDNNDKLAYYTENGIVKEIYITQIDPTSRFSTPFIVSGGTVYQLTFVGGHGSPVGTTKRIAVTPITPVLKDTTLEIDLVELRLDPKESVTAPLTVSFKAGTPAGDPLETPTNSEAGVVIGPSTKTVSYVREAYRATNVNVDIWDVTDPNNKVLAIGYSNECLIEAATGNVTPVLLGEINPSSEIVWYVVTKMADNNNIAVKSAVEIYRTAYTGVASFTLPGNITAQYIGRLVTPVAYTTGYNDGHDQRMGTTAYKVVVNYNNGGTSAAVNLTNSGTQYARLTVGDNGSAANQKTVLTIANIAGLGNAKAIDADKGTVTGGVVTYTLDAADAVNGVITINIKAAAQ